MHQESPRPLNPIDEKGGRTKITAHGASRATGGGRRAPWSGGGRGIPLNRFGGGNRWFAINKIPPPLSLQLGVGKQLNAVGFLPEFCEILRSIPEYVGFGQQEKNQRQYLEYLE